MVMQQSENNLSQHLTASAKKKKGGGGALIGCSLSVARYFIAVSKLILQAHSHLELNSSISEI